MIKHLLNFIVLCATVNLVAYGLTQYGLNGITSTTTNEDVVIDPNGTGKTDMQGDAEVSGTLSVDTVDSLTTNGDLTVTANGSGTIEMAKDTNVSGSFSATNSAAQTVTSEGLSADPLSTPPNTFNFINTNMADRYVEARIQTIGPNDADRSASLVFFTNSDGTAGLETNLSEAGRFSQLGDFGLNVVPDMRLHVKADNSGDGIKLESSSGDDIGFLEDASGSGRLRIAASGGGVTNLITGAAGGNSYVASNSTQFGVGTTTPDFKFEVEGSDVDMVNIKSTHVSGSGLGIDSDGTGGRKYSILSTANSASIGGGDFAIFDNDASLYRMQITSSGNVGIGNELVTPSADLHIADSADTRIRVESTGTGGSNVMGLNFYNENVFEGGMNYSESADEVQIYSGFNGSTPSIFLDSTDGGVHAPFLGNASTANTVYYNTSTDEITYSSSSAKDKKDIRALELDSADIYELDARTFERKSTGETEVGYVAEELEQIFPELVAYNDDGEPVGVWYQWLAPLIIEEVKTLRDRVDSLESRIAALEAQ